MRDNECSPAVADEPLEIIDTLVDKIGVTDRQHFVNE